MSTPPSGIVQSPALELDQSPFHHSSPLSLRHEQEHRPTTPPVPSSDLPPFLRTGASFDSERKKGSVPNIGFDDGYDVFGAVHGGSSSSDELEDHQELSEAHEEDHLDAARRISGNSSISSFPASVSQHPHATRNQYGSPRLRIRRDSTGAASFIRSRGVDLETTSPRSPRVYQSVFRHPSSVRSLQMKDEIMSDTHSVVRHHRRHGSQMSAYSQRSGYSTQTSPLKRDSRSSLYKTEANAKADYPLILLHCTLLPPTVLLQSATSCEDPFICELLPEKYKKRWIALRDKLIGDVEVRTRGILISHPKEEYELLEERLLESLELENPRIRENHYLHGDTNGVDSGFESGSLSEDDADPDCSNGVACPDCGRRLCPEEAERKWEIKVFAANGLMRAGAWGAAWQEMEKVDVEVRVWLPEDVRRDLEAKLALLEASQADMEVNPSHRARDPEEVTSREREVYGDSGRFSSQGNTDASEDERRTPPAPRVPHHEPHERMKQFQLVEYAREFSRDGRNILVGLLSVLVLFFALGGGHGGNTRMVAQTAVPTTPITDMLTTTVTTTKVEISVATALTDVLTPTNTQRPPSTSLSRLEVLSTAVAGQDALHRSAQTSSTWESTAPLSEGSGVSCSVTPNSQPPQSQARLQDGENAAPLDQILE